MHKVTKWHIFVIGLLLILLSGLCVWRSVFVEDTTFDKVLLIIAAALSLAVGSFLFILFAYGFGKRHNAFLYDKATKSEISVDDLTYEKVCSFLDLYIGIIFYKRKQVSIADFNDDEFWAIVPVKYRPLILMRLLVLWIEMDNPNQWKQFAEMNKKDMDIIENILFSGGEQLISSKLQYLRASYEGDTNEIRSFFKDNTGYLKDHIVSYVKSNIHSFDS